MMKSNPACLAIQAMPEFRTNRIIVPTALPPARNSLTATSPSPFAALRRF
jgi:hypothetical protein